MLACVFYIYIYIKYIYIYIYREARQILLWSHRNHGTASAAFNWWRFLTLGAFPSCRMNLKECLSSFGGATYPRPARKALVSARWGNTCCFCHDRIGPPKTLPQTVQRPVLIALIRIQPGWLWFQHITNGTKDFTKWVQKNFRGSATSAHKKPLRWPKKPLASMASRVMERVTLVRSEICKASILGRCAVAKGNFRHGLVKFFGPGHQSSPESKDIFTRYCDKVYSFHLPRDTNTVNLWNPHQD